ncbi:porin [Wielerella bovis]|uniref:porin n=1 Tax=Wielerella bovis TaxID=2917790 RepID=UPI0020199346|nr:porin [Wielerella bovis]ULJ62850.1 porin [Wielerella bovis]
MKKTLIALALTALPVASMADVVLYGTIKGGVETTFSHKKGGQKIDDKAPVYKTSTQIVDYGSRIGFKGHEHLNNNLTAIWQLEQKVNIGGGEAGFSTRDSFVGLKGSFGTVKAGYQSTPLKDLNGTLDIWEYDDNVAGLSHFTRGTDVVKRATAITYETPDFGGFTAKAFVSPSDNNHRAGANGDRDNAVYGLGLSYRNAGFFADVAGGTAKNGANNGAPQKSDPYQALAQAGFENEKFLVGAAYQRAVAVDEDHDVVNEAIVTGAYNVDSALRLKASAAYGWDINEKGGQAKSWGNGKYYQGIVGADYALSKRTVVNGQVGYIQKGKSDTKDSHGVAGVGLSHKF